MPSIGAYAIAKIGFQGKSYYLWQTQLDGGVSADEAAAAGIGPFVTGATVQLNGSTVSQVTVDLDMPFKAGISFLQSGLLTNGNFLAVKLGYLKYGWMSPWYVGRMGGPSVNIDASGVTAQISAQGAGGEMLLNSSGRSWGPQTRWSIIQKLADENKLAVYDPSGARAKLEAQPDFSTSQAGANDWLFLRRICEEVGVRVHGGVNPNDNRASIILADASGIFGSQPVRTIVAMGNFDAQRNRYPLIGFSVETPPRALFTSAAMKGARLLAIDRFGELVDEGATVDDLPDMAAANGSMGDSGDSDAVDPDSGLPNGASPDRGGADDEGAGVVIADAPEGASKEFVYSTLQDGQMGFPATQAKVKTVGIPSAQPYELFEIEGLGAMFDGKYLATNVTHSVSSAGFDTEIDCVRNAVGFAKMEVANKNTSAPSEDGEA